MSEATCGESPDFADAIRATNSTKARMRHPRASDLQPQSLLATNRIFRLTTKCVCIRRFAALLSAALLSEGVFSRHPECGARRGVLRRRLATAAPGGRDPARQALRPGREELAVTEPDPPKLRQRRVTRRGKRGTRRAQNRHGGAPRGERPASWDARRLARRLACRVMCTPTGVPPSTRTSLGAPPTPQRG
jgi:hypothetical protein